MKIISLLLLLFASLSIKAQIPESLMPEIDSLQKSILNAPHDTTRNNSRMKLDLMIYRYDPVLDLKLNQDIVAVCEKTLALLLSQEESKKFKIKNFKNLLVSIQDENLESQKEIINNTFETWKAALEKLDDVCVIGVRV